MQQPTKWHTYIYMYKLWYELETAFIFDMLNYNSTRFQSKRLKVSWYSFIIHPFGCQQWKKAVWLTEVTRFCAMEKHWEKLCFPVYCEKQLFKWSTLNLRHLRTISLWSRMLIVLLFVIAYKLKCDFRLKHWSFGPTPIKKYHKMNAFLVTSV